MPLATKFDLAGGVGIPFLVVPRELNLSEQQRRIVNAEVYAIAVALLGITGAWPSLVAVKNPSQNRQLICDVDEQARSHSCEGRRWPATWQIDRCNRRQPIDGLVKTSVYLVLKNSLSAAS